MKAKNKQKDKFNELVDSIIQLAKANQQLAFQAVTQYTPIVEDIINSKSTNYKHIENSLDYMLDFCFEDKMLQLYKILCQYYYTIDPIATSEYILAYREMWDNEDEQNIIND